MIYMDNLQLEVGATHLATAVPDITLASTVIVLSLSVWLHQSLQNDTNLNLVFQLDLYSWGTHTTTLSMATAALAQSN